MKHILTSADVTDDLATVFYDDAIDGYYDDGPVDWEEALERFEGSGEYDLGDSMLSPAIAKLKREVRRHRQENGLN